MAIESLIHEHAARLRLLNAEIHRTFRLRQRGTAERLAWSAAGRQFRAEYDRLAFPGGLASGLQQLRAFEPNAIEAAVAFLEADPWFFRSGYVKADLLRTLKGAQLTAPQRRRLRRVIMARVRGPDRREFRSYCRLATAVATAGFIAEMEDLAHSTDAATARRAEWMLAALRAISG